MTTARRLALGPLLLALAAGGPLAAQSDPRLVEAVRTAQEGRSDSARAAVQRLLAATSPTDSLYSEILYTQAMVAGEAADMRRALQQVVVEHGASAWADDALLRLVQMDYATRTLDGAARNVEKLRQDYPLTPLLPQAAYWAARTYFDLKNPTLACRWLADGIARAQDNVEMQNQLGFLYQRCDLRPGDSAAAGGRDTVAARDTAAGRDTARVRDTTGTRDTTRRALDSVPPRAAPAAARFRVQVAAVATPGAADEAASKLESLGYTAVIVQERGLYKVRAGAYATREEAQAGARKLKSQIGGSPFVVTGP
jgi:predicted Zn-dependent protease